MSLSKRLTLIASLVPYGARVCDIGTDHARLPIFLIENGRAADVIACDVREKPLEKARENIAAAGAAGITLLLCDGVPDDRAEESGTDTVVIAGIGGEVIAGIIERSRYLCGEKRPLLILQPTTSAEELRRFLCGKGYEILSETPLFENGKLYSVMTVRYSGDKTAEDEFFFYTGLIEPKGDGRLYFEKQYARLKSCADALLTNENKRAEFEYYNGLAKKFERILLNGE